MVGKINIGVVLPEDDETAKFAVSLVTSMDSVSSMCQFTYYEEQSGKEALLGKEIFALVIVPEHFLEDILSGANTPITIISTNQQGMESALFREFAQMGIDMLGYAQIGVYTVWDYCVTDEVLSASADDINYAINNLYFKYTLSRLSLFEEKEISATGKYSFIEYYLYAGIVLITLLCGIPFAFYFGQHNDSFLAACRCKGFYAYQRVIVTYLTAVLAWGSVFGILYGALSGICRLIEVPIDLPLSGFLSGWFAAAGIFAMVQLIYYIFTEKVWGILALFFLSIGMMFLSGGFVPQAFLTDMINNVGGKLPTACWIQMIAEGMQGEIPVYTIIWNLGIFITFLSASCIVETCRERAFGMNRMMQRITGEGDKK